MRLCTECQKELLEAEVAILGGINKCLDCYTKIVRGELGNALDRIGCPIIVCLCGSTRFMDAFFEVGWQETIAGRIVLSVGVCKHADPDGAHGAEALGPDVARGLDELHLRKIDLADEVLILNVGGYIGDSTRRELEYARKLGKVVRFLEPDRTEVIGPRERKQ